MPNFFKIRADSIQLNASASDQLVAIASGQGAPSGSDALGGAAAGIYLREDATTEDTVVYVTRDSGTTWKPLEAGGDTATFTDITVAGGIDHDKALTAAGDGVNSNTSVNHATASAEGIDLLLRQLTTARTAGTMSAIKAAGASLGGHPGGGARRGDRPPAAAAHARPARRHDVGDQGGGDVARRGPRRDVQQHR